MEHARREEWACVRHEYFGPMRLCLVGTHGRHVENLVAGFAPVLGERTAIVE